MVEIVGAISYEDGEGYSVTVAAFKDNGWQFHGDRQGMFVITSPAGAKLMSGCWMNYPEEDDPAYADWIAWFRNETNVPPQSWYGRPLLERLAQEARIQATRYESLKEQFAQKRNALRGW